MGIIYATTLKKKLALFSSWNSRKMRLTAYRTPTVRGILHLPFFSSSRPFVASPLFMKGTMLCYKEKLEPSVVPWQIFKRSQVCTISVVHICIRFVEFDTSVLCHVLVYCFGSFLSQDIFLSLQVFAFEGQNMTFIVNVLLSILWRRPRLWLEVFASTVGRLLSRVSYLTSGKLFSLFLYFKRLANLL